MQINKNISTEPEAHITTSKNTIFYVRKSLINYMSFFLILIFEIFFLKFLSITPIVRILVLLISFPVLFVGLSKILKQRSQIINLTEEDITFTLFSGYRISFLIKLLSNSLNKITVNYNNIEKLYKGSGILDDETYYINIINGNNESFEKITLLHTIDKKKDFEELKRLLNLKGIIIEM